MFSVFSTCSSCHTSSVRCKTASARSPHIGHSLVLRELADTVRQSEKSKARRRVHTDAPVPDRKHIYADMAKLFLRDLANVEAGIYPGR